MPLIRIAAAAALDGFRVRLTLTDGSVVERDLAPLLSGSVFDEVRASAVAFRRVQVEGGSIAWENGADLDPDVLIWGGPPPESPGSPPQSVDFRSHIVR
jgi:hypothetical protein